MKAIGAKNLAEIGDHYKSFDVIAIDEGQFFPDVHQFLLDLIFMHRLYLGVMRLPMMAKWLSSLLWMELFRGEASSASFS
jgi:hypothetical protein